MTAPARVQRKRTKGWRMPPGTIHVARPTRWGNPFPTRGEAAVWCCVALGMQNTAENRATAAVTLYRHWLAGALPVQLPRTDIAGVAAWMAETSLQEIGAAPSLDEITARLRGHHLACWCRLDQPCHADVLLEIANR